MTEPEFRMRPAGGEDTPAILELMKASLGEGRIPRTEEFWTWKHRDNPFGVSPVWVAEAEAGIVGVRVFLRWTWRRDGAAVRAVRAVDTATHPDFQGRGIFRALTLRLVEDVAREPVEFVYNTPNDKSRPGYLKMGWESVGRVSLWVRASAKGVARALGGREDDEEEGDDWSGEDTAAVPPGVVTKLAYEELASVHAAAQRLHTPIDRAYVEWRYLRCPAVKYSFASVDPDRALVVYRRRRRGRFRELTLCDVLAHRSTHGTRAARETLRRLVKAEAPDYAIGAAHAVTFEAPILAGAGFLPAPRTGPILTVRRFTVGASDPRVASSWGCSVGDLELF